MVNCRPCPVETPGMMLFPPRSSAAVPYVLRHQECLLMFLNRERTSAGAPSALQPGDCKGTSIHTPPLARGALCSCRDPVLPLIPWDGFMTFGEGRLGRGWDTSPRCPSHRYPSTPTQGSQHSTAPSHGYPSTQLPQCTATPAHRYPDTQVP